MPGEDVDGTTPPAGGNGGRRDRGHTVTSVQDAVVKREDWPPTDAMRLPWSNSSATPPATPPPSNGTTTGASRPSSPRSGGHKRSVSGALFSRLSIFRSHDDGRSSARGDRAERAAPNGKTAAGAANGGAVSRKSIDDDPRPALQISPPVATEQDGTPSEVPKPNKTRKRRGSLRKTALLGGRSGTAENGDHKSGFTPVKDTVSETYDAQNAVPQAIVGCEEAPPASLDPLGMRHPQGPSSRNPPVTLRRQFSYEQPGAASSSESGWSETADAPSGRLFLLTDHARDAEGPASSGFDSPVEVKSPASQLNYASTTDDDEGVTFTRPPHPPDPALLSAAAAPYSPPSSSFSALPGRRRSSKRSPLSRTAPVVPPTYPEPGPPDYSETEYWGWVILLVTWVTFTVGMGSCLDVWSWAWDVGETPHAPPELENDPTLPIVGYYPALMVLTAVVAWFWVTAAWVGMKYFRHATMEV